VSPRGSLELDGPLSGYQLSLDTRLEPSGSPPLDLRLDGHGSLASVSLTLNLQAGDGSVQGEIDAAWDPVIQGEVSLALKDLDPSVVAAEWPGSVDAKVAASAQMEGDRVEVTVSRLDASGRLRDQDLSVAAQGRYVEDASGRTIDVDDLVAALGATRVDVNGRVGERADLRWQLASDDLSGLLPEARGRLSGSGQLTGPLPEVSLEARLEADNLAYAEHSLQRLDLSAELDLSGGTRSQLNVAAQQASLAGTAVSRLTLEGSGTAANHHIQLLLNAEPGRAEIGVDGNLEDPWGDNPAWHFTLSEGELAYQQLAPWRLAESAEGTLTGQHVRLARQCWEASQARVCLQGHRDSQGLAGDLDLSNLRFAYFAGLLPKEVEPTGAVSGSARVVQPDGGVLTAQADVTTTEGQVSFPAVSPEDGSESAVIRFQPSNLTFSLDASEARGEIDLNLEHGQLRAQAATPVVVSGADDADARQPPTDPTLTGSLVLDVPDLSFLSPLLPTVEALKGKVSGDLRLAGTMGQPAVTGSLDLSGGSVFVPEPGITVTDLSLSLQGRGRDPVALQASASSGGGSLSLDGSMSLPGAVPTARLAFTGNEFQVLNNDDGRVFVSPDLNLDAGPERVTLSGRVHVPRAEITPESRSPSAATVSQDQVLVSEEAESATEPERELHAEVRLTLGDQVHFDGFGLTARIEGDVLVEQQPETPTTATGELRILDGEYRAYGQGLVIDSGRIYFAGGPVTHPALDVRAVRRPKEGILVGAHVQGTLQSPSFELFSEPSMAEQEQLSYLVLGRSLDEAPDGQGSALSRAALAMGLKGGDFLAKNIGQQVGLDQIGIETGSGEAGAPSDPSDAALVVGKYLSPKLYVSYGIGLFDPESVLEMQYEISRRWTFVTQSSGESTGADVLYTVELGSK
jgi:translocation and assembly module TamB